MIEILPRPLSARERDVLTAIYTRLPGRQRDVLAAQLDGLEVSATWAVGSASVEIRPARGIEIAAADVADGVLPVRAVVQEGADAAGEILVWMERGVPSSIEYAYYLGDTPSELPGPERISFV